jgi:hypothetical protein
MEQLLLESFLELHAVTLGRMKCLISILERKGVLTRAEIDALGESMSKADLDADFEKVSRLFEQIVADRSDDSLPH